MFRKSLWISAFVLAFAGTSLYPVPGKAFSLDVNQTTQGVLVPFARFDTSGKTTAVGLVSSRPGIVHWGFFDANGVQQAHGTINLAAAYRLHPFIWSQQAPAALAGVSGYLLFAIDTNSDGLINGVDDPALGASAFYVVPPDDVVFIPVQAAPSGVLVSPNPANWTINGVAPGAYVGPGFTGGTWVYTHYLIDGAPGGDNTNLYLWCDTNFTQPQNIILDDGNGTTQTVTLPMSNTRLNIIDVESISGLNPALFGDGFVRWQLTGQTGGCTVFSTASSPTFSASQTLLGKQLSAP